MSQEIFSVSELNQFIKDVISAGFPQSVWVCGEIQGYSRNKNKNHIFFELVENDSESKDVKSRVSLVLFARRKEAIHQILKQSENAFSLEDDIEVKFLCKVDYYAPHGAVRLVVENIDPVYTLGKLAQEKQKLIALLKEKGVLDKNKQRALPLVPLRIGLITSDDSAAFNDFFAELKKSGYGFNLFVRNTLMQGKRSEADVVQALRCLDKKDVDVLVITRGGGSIADLSCFDSRRIAEAIAASPLPVLSGIGHEINTTITDLAAHTYAKTPTAIARFLVKRIEDFVGRLEDGFLRVSKGSVALMDKEKLRVKEQALALRNRTISYLRSHHHAVVRWTETIRQRPLRLVKDAEREISVCGETLCRIARSRLVDENKKINGYHKIVEAVHPANTLRRGFSITRDSKGRVIQDVHKVKAGEILKTETLNGAIKSEVKEINDLCAISEKNKKKVVRKLKDVSQEVQPSLFSQEP